MSEKFEIFRAPDGKTIERKSRQKESFGLVQKAIEKISQDPDLMEKYLRKVQTAELSIFNNKSHKKVMKKIITFYIADNYLSGPKKDELAELVEGIAEKEIKEKGGFHTMWDNYQLAFGKVYAEIDSKTEKRWKGDPNDWRKRAAGDYNGKEDNQNSG